MNALRCAGVPIMPLSRTEASDKIIQLALDGPPRPMNIHLCNAYTLALADKSPKYFDLLNESGINLPDGMSVAWTNRVIHWRQHASTVRVRGTDLFLDVFEKGNDHGLRHFLLGSTPEVLTSLTRNLEELFPGIQIVGTESPPFRELTDAEREAQLGRIAESNAQVVWVGLGTPKQDFESARLASQLPLVFVAVGAAFDFVAGTKAEAPAWMQGAGLEWVHRLISEPRRLWRRYLFGNAQFLWAVVRRYRYEPGI